MTNGEKSVPARRRWKRWSLAVVGPLGALVLGGVVFLQSALFQEMVRRRLVVALEQATGGRVELEGFSLHLSRLQVDLQGLTLHGREGPQEPPLFSTQLLQVGWKIFPVWDWPVWNWRADLRMVRVWSPEIYVAVYENGHNNFPLPPRKTVRDGNLAEKVLALRVKRLEVLRGQFRWNENRLPVDFQAENFHFALEYEAGVDRYSGRIDFQNALFISRNAAPLPSGARARFYLDSQKAEIVSLEWQTSHSRLSAQGMIEDFRAPRLQFRYDLLLNLKEAAELLGSSGWLGDVAWRGQGSYGDRGWQLEGDLGLRNVKAGIGALREVSWGARSSFRLVRPASAGSAEDGKPPPWRAELQGLEVTTLGGKLTGAATVEIAAPAAATRLDLEVDRLSFPALSEALSALQAPLAGLRWAGAVSGPVQASFVGMGNRLTLRNDFRVDPPPVVPPGFTSVSGILRGSYTAERRRWESEGSYLKLPQTHLRADGWLGDKDSRLSVALDTTNLAECQSLAALFGKRLADYPLKLQGQAQAKLLWSGGTRSPTLDGNFQVTEFTYENTRWDGFSGKLRYSQGPAEGKLYSPASPSPEDSNAGFAEIAITSGRLWKGDAMAGFDLRLGLENGSFTSQSPFSIEASLRNTALEDVQNLAGVWLPIQGSLVASARASGTRQNQTVDANFQITDFAYQNTQWEGFSGKLHYSQGSGEGKVHSAASQPPHASSSSFAEIALTSGRLWKGNAMAQFDASLGLENGSFAPQSPFFINASLRNTNLEDLQSIVGVSLPVRGTLQASVRASGTRQDPSGQSEVTVTAGAAYGEPFDRLTGQLALEPGGIFSAKQIRLQKGEAALEGEAVVQARTKQYRFSLTGSDIPIEAFPLLQTPRFPATGLAQVKFSGEGSLSQPRVQGKLDISKLSLGGDWEGKLSLSVETRDGRAHLQLTSNFLRGEVRGSGEVSLRGSFPLSARLEFANLNVASLLRAGREAPEGVQGRAGGTVTVEGELENLKMARIRAEVANFDGAAGRVLLRNGQPWRFRYQDGLIQLEQLHLVGKDVDLGAKGTIRLTADRALNLTAKGFMNLAALEIFDPDLSSSGRVLLEANLGGTLEKPLWKGRLEFSEGDLRYGNLPNGLTKMKGALIFEANRGSLENFTAESGGGEVELGGLVSYEAETGLQMQLSAKATGIRVRYPQGISILLDGQLTLTGTRQSSLLAGRLAINKLTTSPQFDLAAVLIREQDQTEALSESAFLRNMRLDLQIISVPNIRVETAAARNLRGEVDLRLRGTVDRPALLGRIGILQGEISFAGTRYRVNRGEITFLNPFRIEPILSLNVQARVQQYEISLDFTGPTDRLNITYRSEPPLPTRDILALLAAGRSQERSLETNLAQAVPETGPNTLLSQALSGQISSRLDRIFGSGRVRIDPQIAGFHRAANASIALEQQISDNLRILYVTNLTSTQQQIIQAEWTISPRLSVVVIRDQNGLFGVNFQIQKRFR